MVYRTATKLLHPCLSLASLWMAPQLCGSSSSFPLPQFFVRLSSVDHGSAFPPQSSGLQLWWLIWHPCTARAQSSAIDGTLKSKNLQRQLAWRTLNGWGRIKRIFLEKKRQQWNPSWKASLFQATLLVLVFARHWILLIWCFHWTLLIWCFHWILLIWCFHWILLIQCFQATLSWVWCPHGPLFTWWGCCGLCFWHKPTEGHPPFRTLSSGFGVSKQLISLDLEVVFCNHFHLHTFPGTK